MIEDSIIMLGDADGDFSDPKALAGTTVGLHVYVENVDALFHQAITAGGEAIQPV
jgi:PhnB protein